MRVEVYHVTNYDRVTGERPRSPTPNQGGFELLWENGGSSKN